MSAPKDGGPAFPGPQPILLLDPATMHGVEKIEVHMNGMSLRDWFAGQALVGLCAAGHAIKINGRDTLHEVTAFMLADAMLAQRAKDPS